MWRFQRRARSTDLTFWNAACHVCGMHPSVMHGAGKCAKLLCCVFCIYSYYYYYYKTAIFFLFYCQLTPNDYNQVEHKTIIYHSIIKFHTNCSLSWLTYAVRLTQILNAAPNVDKSATLNSSLQMLPFLRFEKKNPGSYRNQTTACLRFNHGKCFTKTNLRVHNDMHSHKYAWESAHLCSNILKPQ